MPEGGLIEAKVKWYNGRKGFGFVLGPDGQDVFFHASALTDAGIEQPDTDDTLVCEIGSDRTGRRLVTRITELKRGPGGGASRGFGGAPGGFGRRSTSERRHMSHPHTSRLGRTRSRSGALPPQVRM